MLSSGRRSPPSFGIWSWRSGLASISPRPMCCNGIFRQRRLPASFLVGPLALPTLASF
jgi:hypothetical protein